MVTTRLSSGASLRDRREEQARAVKGAFTCEGSPDARSPRIKSSSSAAKEDAKATASQIGSKPRIGPLEKYGVVVIMVASHIIQYYFWACLYANQGNLLLPAPGEAPGAFGGRLWRIIATGAAPTWTAAVWYLSYLAFNGLLSAFLPGVTTKGLPLKDGTRLQYNCNGLLAWYITLAVAIPLQFVPASRLTPLCHMLGPMLTVSAVVGNGASLAAWAAAHWNNAANRATGNFGYDFFMGVYLNPRLLGGRLDVKMWAETRVSWYLLFLITLSCASEQVKTTGRLSGAMLVMVVAHALYANACAKGEECIPTTWDIFHENWGWMLAFWNLCGVPFMYSWQSVFVLRQDPVHSPWYTGALLVTLLAAYYVWDSSQSQKNRFRMAAMGVEVARPHAFPQLPWGTLVNPRTVETKAGSALLVDGWWRYARKPHYAADMVMSFCWGATCGFSAVLPWVYFIFFTSFLMHRAHRDVRRCRAKYGADWDRYTAIVPYMFIPGVF